jgi:hypothetical protein
MVFPFVPNISHFAAEPAEADKNLFGLGRRHRRVERSVDQEQRRADVPVIRGLNFLIGFMRLASY